MTDQSPSPFLSNTLIGIFFAQAACNPTGSCLTFFEAGQWRTLSWQEAEQQVGIFAKRLLHLGVRPKDRVVQISENRYEWMILDLAIQAVGAVHIPINPQLTREQAQIQLTHCQPNHFARRRPRLDSSVARARDRTTKTFWGRLTR